MNLDHIYAYSPETGSVRPQEYMEFDPKFTFIVDGVAKIKLPEEYWQFLTIVRYIRQNQPDHVLVKLPGWGKVFTDADRS